jgi:heptosyltransferase-1
MAEILFIKTSSLGDVIHHLPALTEARRQRPDARFTWVVEEDLVPLVRLHPAVDAAIPVASRRWRRNLLQPATWGEMATFARTLRARRYDAVIDTQGLLRSAAIARLTHGERHGYDAASIRERFAAPLYQVGHRVDRSLHAIARNRILTGLALGYAPEGPPDYGLAANQASSDPAEPYGILLHATARAEKQWPDERWIAAGLALARRGFELALPWGSPAERARSERLAAALPSARIPERQPLDRMARTISRASFVIGVDTGLLHLAAAFAVPLVGIFVGSEPGLTGPMGTGPLAVVGAKGQPPGVDEVVGALERILPA